jgi:hypothetical protein
VFVDQQISCARKRNAAQDLSKSHVWYFKILPFLNVAFAPHFSASDVQSTTHAHLAFLQILAFRSLPQESGLDQLAESQAQPLPARHLSI